MIRGLIEHCGGRTVQVIGLASQILSHVSGRLVYIR